MAQATDIGIDFGTTNILVYVKGKGIVLKEPAIVAYDKDSDKVKGVGEEARQMVGRTPGNIMAIRPLKEGVISDFIMTEKMLRYFIQKAMGRRGFRKPRIVICVPSGVTDVERRAVEEATFQAGAREVTIVEESIAAAIGAGIDITRPCGNLIVDIGGGATDIAVISLAGVVASASIPCAGNAFTESIIRFVRKKYNLFIGEQTADAVKMRLGNAFPTKQQEIMEIRGRNVVSGLPKSIILTSDEVREAMKDPIDQIVSAVQGVLERISPELASDIVKRGILLAGGGALLPGLEDVMREKTGITTTVAENPATVVVNGTARYVQIMAEFEGR